MKALLRPETFKYDIIANLPFELSLQIFSYLETYLLARSRRVSRRWFELLSALPKFSSSYLRLFFGARYPDRMEKGSSLACDLPRMTEELDAYRTGRAFSKRFFEWDLPYQSRHSMQSRMSYFKSQTAYCNGTVAWIDEDRGILRTLHLDANFANTYTVTEREALTHITLSESIVAATTVTGRCYVFELASGAVHVIRLQSALTLVSSLVSTGKTIAILQYQPAHRDSLLYLTTWSLTSRKTRSFSPDVCSVPTTTGRHSYNVLVHPEETSLIYLKQTIGPPPQLPNTRTSGETTIVVTRLALDGQMMSRSSLTIDNTSRDRELGTPVPCDNGGSFVIWSDHPHDDYQLVRLIYQSQTGSLELQLLPKLANAPSRYYPENIFYWEDSTYGFRVASKGSDDEMVVADFDQGVCRDAEMWSLSMTDRQAAVFNRYHEGRQIVGDDRFILVLHPKGFIAWCFDKTFTMANDCTFYREGRAAEIKRRLEDNERLKRKCLLCEECLGVGFIVRPPAAEVTL